MSTEHEKLCTVFVGGISWKAEEGSLKEFFGRYGPVTSCKIIVDRETNKSKGYGFVTFNEPETAEAVKQATDLQFLGKTMNVGEAYRKTNNVKGSSPTPVGHPNIPIGYGGYPVPPFMPYGFSPPGYGMYPPPPYMNMPYGYDPYYGSPPYYDASQYWAGQQHPMHMGYPVPYGSDPHSASQEASPDRNELPQTPPETGEAPAFEPDVNGAAQSLAQVSIDSGSA